MSNPYASWMQSWAPLVDAGIDINTGVQDQNVTAFNGAGNLNLGDFTVAASQNVGDVELPYSPMAPMPPEQENPMAPMPPEAQEPSPGVYSPIGIDASTDINTGIQDQNITAFNGAGNANGGNFTAIAQQNVGDVELGGSSAPSLADLSYDENFGQQTQNVTAFNGAGNINAGDFTVAASQNVGDFEMPSAGSLFDGSTDINTGYQTQNVTAFNGAGNANGGNFTVVAEQNVGDVEVPMYDDMAG